MSVVVVLVVVLYCIVLYCIVLYCIVLYSHNLIYYNLLQLTGLRRVACEAVSDFDRIGDDLWDSAKRVPSCNKDARLYELLSSLIKCNEVLLSSSAEVVLLPLFSQRYPVGCVVSSVYGSGIVIGFDNSNGVYKIIMHLGKW